MTAKEKKMNMSIKKLALVFGAIAIFAFIAIGGFTILGNNKNSGVPSTNAATTYSLFWSDEFNGTSVDTTRWGVYHNNYGSGNNELECNTPSNAAVVGGNLVITGKKQTYTCPGAGTYQYTSAFLGSRDASTKRYYPLYGRYEMRARVPHGQGLWPAFWLRHALGSSNAEVDVVEEFHNQQPGKITSTLHFPATLGSNVSKKSTFVETPVQGTPGAWHTYAVQIEPATAGAVKFTFFIDNVQTLTYTNTNASSWTTGYENGAWDIALNMAIGGKYVGNPESQLGYLPDVNKCSLSYAAPLNNDPTTCSTTGIFLSGLSKANAEYQVDYVRVYTPSTTTTTADTTAPAVSISAPTTNSTLSGVVTSNASATDASGVVRGEMYVNGTLKQTLASAGPFSGTVDTATLTNGAAVNIQWKAYDAAGNVGIASTSGTVSNTTVDTQAPSVPANVVVKPVDPAVGVPIDITWNASTDNVGVAKYLVTRDGGYTVGYTTTTSYSDTTADKSTCTKYCHTYIIYALDAAGNKSAGSAQALGLVADTTAPSTPANLVVIANAYNKVSLSWTASTDNAAVAGYYVLRNGVTLGSTTATTYVDTTTAPGTKYTYQILAYDAAGNTAASASVATTTPATPDTAAPSVPAGVTATAVNSSQINVGWSASTDNIGVSSYKVYRNGAVVGTVSATAGTSFGDSGLAAGTSYSYTVVACDGAGNCSAQSSVASATTYNAVVAVVAGAIQGVVKNQSGATLAKVRVTASNGTNSFTTYTNTQGNYALFNLTPDTYTVRYSSRKYQVALSTVSVSSGARVTNNVTLVIR